MEPANKIITEIKFLHRDLLSFKNDPNFIQFGFAKGGKYKYWMDTVKELLDSSESKLLVKRGIFPLELYSLGLAYVVSKGEETENTRKINKYLLSLV